MSVRARRAPVRAECPEIVRNAVHDAFCIVERDDGLFEIGLGDEAAGPFESRIFAEAVAHRDTGDPPKRRRPPGANRRALIDRLEWAAATNEYDSTGISATDFPSPRPATTGRYRAVLADGLVLGSFGSRLDAVQASGVRQ